jgi:LacI family transcriptional regulator
MAGDEMYPAGRATLEDVARAAGVSLATVDRVVNRREGVRAKTVARVEAAVAKLGYRADVAAARLARGQTFRFAFVLPTGSNSFMMNLTEQVQRTADWLAGQRGFIDIIHVDVFDPDALAGALEQLSPAYAGVATIALDHPRVRAAIDDLADRDVAVVTLVSDAPSSRRLHYVASTIRRQAAPPRP